MVAAADLDLPAVRSDRVPCVVQLPPAGASAWVDLAVSDAEALVPNAVFLAVLEADDPPLLLSGSAPLPVVFLALALLHRVDQLLG